eukprot:gene22627-1352_t
MSKYLDVDDYQELEETEFDVIMNGTGFVECLLAGALARSGQKVLHMDRSSWYGEDFASVTLDQLLDWLEVQQANVKFHETECEKGEVENYLRGRRGYNVDISPLAFYSD